MSDDAEIPILDLGPALVAKKRRECTHDRVEVDDELDYLECADCGAEVNPYQWIRHRADHETALKDSVAEIHAEYLRWRERLQAQLRHHQAEINHLIDVKNRLWNETSPDGRPLGAVAARVRKRRVTSPR